MQQVEFRAMGCQMLAIVDDDTSETAEVLAEVPFWFEQWEQSLSRFREDSELSDLNRRSGRAVRVSSVMWQVVRVALDVARQTDGLVVPHMLGALEFAGYDRSFELLASGGAAGTSPPPAVGANDWQAIELGSHPRTIFLPAGLRLDLGGVAKGWAAQQAMKRLRLYGPALVNAGGDIAVSAPQFDGRPWPVTIEDPFGRDDRLSPLRVFGGGVATSGRDYRRWQQGDTMQHHIIDPRSGRPAETDVMSVTVAAPTTLAAEAAAKSVLILGSAAGLAWLNARSELAALLVLEDERVLFSERFGDYSGI